MNESARSAVRAFASLSNGVHAISHAEAVSHIRASVQRSADGDHPDAVSSGQRLVWLDVTHPGDEEATMLRDAIGFHPLAVEDCIGGRQRPKLDRYPRYFFLVIYAAAVNPERQRMALNGVHLFIGDNFLVTVHDQPVEEVGGVLARWRSAPDQVSGVGTLAHQLLDVIVDDYFTVLAHMGQKVEQLEGVVFSGDARADSAEILKLRHELVLFRRIVVPQRDVLSTILRRDLPFLGASLLPYFQDVHDHTIRVTEEIDSLRELLTALLDAQLSTSAHHLGSVMRVMTAWSIILMSMTLVAGIYGMNFIFMPELELRFGYVGALALMAAIGVSLFVYFRRRSWL